MNMTERTRIERALSTLPVPAAPVANIRAAFERRRGRTRQRRLAALFFAATIVASFAVPNQFASHAIAATVSAAEMIVGRLMPSHPSQIYFLGRESHVHTEFTSYTSVDDMRQAVRFPIRIAPASLGWHLESVLLSDGDPKSAVLFYHTKRGGYAVFNESPNDGKRYDRVDLSGLLEDQRPPKYSSHGMSIKETPNIKTYLHVYIQGPTQVFVEVTESDKDLLKHEEALFGLQWRAAL
jgi:hypothetical protein